MASRTIVTRAAAVSLALAIWAGSAQAQLTPATPPNCSVSDVTDGVNNALACSGAWAGNNKNQQADVFTQLVTDFGSFTGAGSFWSYIGASDDAGNGPFTSGPGGASGTLTFDSNQKGFFVVSLKAADSFSLYLFDGTGSGIGSVQFVTDGTGTNNQGIPQGLSHAGLYRFNAPLSTPEPSTYVLTLSGLAGVLTLRRRRAA